WEEAVYLFLYLSYLKLNSNNRHPYSKERFIKLVSNFEKKLQFPYYNSLKTTFDTTKNFKDTFLKIPKKQRELFVMAYQSYLFNECIKEVLASSIGRKNLEKVNYEAGFLYFLKNSQKNVELPLSFSLIGRKDEFNDFEKEIISTILQREKIEFSLIKSLSKTGVFLKTHQRNILTIPQHFKVETIVEEDFLKSKNRKTITISFELEKGSYATNIIKFLFRK
ncbi:MAG: tRNA pseudouridine(13) synthase TruD, partial [Nanoarchaeota archaeon]|nr:tRNA pseudouridine(13) synthase TruD [Nanoarchaeota archaeon]